MRAPDGVNPNAREATRGLYYVNLRVGRTPELYCGERGGSRDRLSWQTKSKRSQTAEKVHAMSRHMTWCSVFLCSSVMCQPAGAQLNLDSMEDVQKPTRQEKKRVPKTGVSAILGLLDWSDGHQAVLQEIGGAIDARYAKMLKASADAIEVDRLLHQKRSELATIRGNYVQFAGGSTGYESSLISSEFVHSAGEAMVRVDDPNAQRYYFFRNDRLWKILVAYNTGISRDTPFTAFVRQARAKYGRPIEIESEEGAGSGQIIVAATWEDDLTRLIIEDRTEFFGALVMKFLDRKEGLEIESSHPDREDVTAPPVEDQTITAAMSEIGITDGPDAVDDDIVDRLTGQEHEVNLKRGRPVYETLDRSPAVTKSKQPRKRGKPSKRRKSQKKEDFDTPPADPGIVY